MEKARVWRLERPCNSHLDLHGCLSLWFLALPDRLLNTFLCCQEPLLASCKAHSDILSVGLRVTLQCLGMATMHRAVGIMCVFTVDTEGSGAEEGRHTTDSQSVNTLTYWTAIWGVLSRQAHSGDIQLLLGGGKSDCKHTLSQGGAAGAICQQVPKEHTHGFTCVCV